MINITTLQGAKDVLSQYSGDEYCVIGPQNTDNIVVGFKYWLVKITDVDKAIYHYEEVWSMITKIPEDIVSILIDEGYLVSEISKKEWNVQVALGTAPYRRYLINVDEIKEKDKL